MLGIASNDTAVTVYVHVGVEDASACRLEHAARMEPARACAEALGILIDMAKETLPSLWRLREMQGFIRALLADRTRLLTIPDLVAILNALPQSRWTDLLGEGIGTLSRELVEKAAPVPELVQCFGEQAREVRGD